MGDNTSNTENARNACILTGNSRAREVANIEKFPVFIGCVDTPFEDDEFHPFIVDYFDKTGTAQLRDMPELDQIYSSQTTQTAVGKTWQAHHQEFHDFIHSGGLGRDVLELGAANGYLSTLFAAKDWLIIEPNPAPVVGCNAKFIKGFLSEENAANLSGRDVVHSHVLEHTMDPLEFCRTIAINMSVGRNLYISVPCMTSWLEKNSANAFNFEHSFYLPDDFIVEVMTQQGFRLNKKKIFGDKHSVFYAFTKVKSVELEPRYLGADPGGKCVIDYLKRTRKIVERINQKLTANRGVQSYIFGGSIFTQWLVFNGLEISGLRSVLDNDKGKQGLRLYGTELFVMHPEDVNWKSPSLVILAAGVYNDEIRDQLQKLSNNISFLDLKIED